VWGGDGLELAVEVAQGGGEGVGGVAASRLGRSGQVAQQQDLVVGRLPGGDFVAGQVVEGPEPEQ